jgi:hypothetical protein
MVATIIIFTATGTTIWSAGDGSLGQATLDQRMSCDYGLKSPSLSLGATQMLALSLRKISANTFKLDIVNNVCLLYKKKELTTESVACLMTHKTNAPGEQVWKGTPARDHLIPYKLLTHVLLAG